MHVTATHRRCSDGSCPAVHDTDDPALIAVRGSARRGPRARAGLANFPGREEAVVLAWSLLESHVRERR